MKPFIFGFGILVGSLITAGMILISTDAHASGNHEWSGWWKLDELTKVQRIYDDENGLVCWLATNSRWLDKAPSISCVKM